MSTNLSSKFQKRNIVKPGDVIALKELIAITKSDCYSCRQRQGFSTSLSNGV